MKRNDTDFPASHHVARAKGFDMTAPVFNDYPHTGKEEVKEPSPMMRRIGFGIYISISLFTFILSIIHGNYGTAFYIVVIFFVYLSERRRCARNVLNKAGNETP